MPLTIAACDARLEETPEPTRTNDASIPSLETGSVDASSDTVGTLPDAGSDAGAEPDRDASVDVDVAADDAASDAGPDAEVPIPDAAVPYDAAACTTGGLPVQSHATPNPLPRRDVEMAFFGSCFTPSSTVQFLGNSGWLYLNTTFVSPTELRARSRSRFTPEPKTYSRFQVVNPNGVSDVLVHPVVAVAVISRLTPASVPAGSESFRLTITGDGRTTEATDGTPVATWIQAPAKVYWNTTELTGAVYTGNAVGNSDVWQNVTVDVPASLVAAPGTVQITVANPGVAVSPPFAFTIL